MDTLLEAIRELREDTRANNSILWDSCFHWQPDIFRDIKQLRQDIQTQDFKKPEKLLEFLIYISGDYKSRIPDIHGETLEEKAITILTTLYKHENSAGDILPKVLYICFNGKELQPITEYPTLRKSKLNLETADVDDIIQVLATDSKKQKWAQKSQETINNILSEITGPVKLVNVGWMSYELRLSNGWKKYKASQVADWHHGWGRARKKYGDACFTIKTEINNEIHEISFQVAWNTQERLKNFEHFERYFETNGEETFNSVQEILDKFDLVLWKGGIDVIYDSPEEGHKHHIYNK